MNLVFEELKIEISHSPELNNVIVMVWLDDSLVAEGVYKNISEMPSVKQILLQSGICL